MARALATIVLLALVAACATAERRALPAEVEVSAAAPGEPGPALDYLAVLPKGSAARAGSWPVVLFLHGSGERGGPLAQVKVHGPFGAAAADPDFPFLILAPHLPEGGDWDPDEVVGVLDDAARRWPVDRARVYLTGLSRGGRGTWATAAAHPERFAAIAPVSGGGDPAIACALKSMPIRAAHGARDDVVPVGEHDAVVAAVRACGGSPDYTVHADLGHDAWTRTYADPGLYRWLLEQRRQRR